MPTFGLRLNLFFDSREPLSQANHEGTVIFPHSFPLAPIGGLFVAVVGMFLIGGGIIPKFRFRSLWVGLAVGSAAAVIFALRFPVPAPSKLQVTSLLVAVLAEVFAFVALTPRFYRAGERAVVSGTLAIVGGHFIIMLPAFGPMIAVTGLLCLGNAALLWIKTASSTDNGWAMDGAIKLIVGSMMVAGFGARPG